jgi:putative CocE/NonD family hydrolase
MGMLDRFSEVDLPVLHITGWFDGDQLGQLYYWREMAAHSPARDRQFLLSGPWDHAGTRSPEPRHGELEFGDAAVLDMNAIHLRWFDYWLRDRGDAPTDFAPGCRSRIFLMGENRWRDDRTWPPPGAAPTRFYLRGGGRANTAAGDGRLESQPPPEGEPADRYTYDPEAPTPSSETEEGFPPEVKLDQGWLLRREDVLVYTSAPLAGALEVTGAPFVILEAATDAPDTDFAATLYDVHPDGCSLALCDGIVRASYRSGSGRPETAPLDPGRPYTYRIELVAISNVFLPGHRIRVAVMSARWPAYDRNPNTGAPPGDDAATRPASQSVLHEPEHPSHLLLPVVPRPTA